MLYVLAFLGTAVLVTWLVLLNLASIDLWKQAAYNKLIDLRQSVLLMQEKQRIQNEKMDSLTGIEKTFYKLFKTEDYGKKIKKCQKQEQELKRGNLRSMSLLDIPGYTLLEKFPAIKMSELYKHLVHACFELYGKKHMNDKATQMLARMVSYGLVGVGLTMLASCAILTSGDLMRGIVVLGGGLLLVFILVYAMYDDVNSKLLKRRKRISRQFPAVVSKLALLVTSGMIMDRAWKETAYSKNGDIYLEMQRTAEELDNLVNPELAYSNFIDRCNTKETAKLASAIMQNKSKGNAEIGMLLKEMAAEAWVERRNMAKRDSEAANSKLMIPTMLLFVSILGIIMVPVLLSFQSF